MSRYTTSSLIVLTAVILGLGTAAAKSDHEKGHHAETHKDVKVVVVDDEGETHEHVWSHHDDGKRAFLGVQVEGSESGDTRIGKVVGDSAAEKAGLLDGDVIVSFNGEPVGSPVDLTRAIRGVEPGQAVAIEVLRDGQSRTVTAEMGERPGHSTLWFGDGDNPFVFEFNEGEWTEKMEELKERLGDLEVHVPHMDFHHALKRRPMLGVQIVQTTPELRNHLGGSDDTGVLVGKVMEGMPAEDGGVLVGDLIVAVDGEAVRDSGDLVHALSEKAGSTITLDIIRDGRSMALSIFIPKPEVEDVDTGKNTFFHADPEQIKIQVLEALEAAQLGEEQAALVAEEAALALREAEMLDQQEIKRVVEEAQAAAHAASLVQREEMNRAMEEARRAYAKAVKQSREDAEWY